MYAFDMSFQRELARTTWSFYSVGMVIIALRIYGQIHRLGIKGLKIDDYLMLVAAVLYTMLVVCLNIIARGGGSNLFEPDELSTFSAEEIKERIYGSKIVVVSEQAMLNLIYLLKVCILLMYRRLTIGTKHGKLIKYVGGYVAVGWLATEIAFFTACRPFNGYWAVPPPDPQCTTLAHYAIIQGCFNISGDLMIIFIPLPIIASLQLPLKQKVMLGVVFSMGFFVITAAILTKVFNLSNVYDTAYMLWYTREASVAVYVANLPMIWPLLREWVPYLRSGLTRSGGSELPRFASDSDPRSAARSAARNSMKHHSGIMQAYDDFDMTLDHKEDGTTLDTGSDRGSDNVITPVNTTTPLPRPSMATARIPSTDHEKEQKTPVAEKHNFGFANRPVSWSLEEGNPPQTRSVPSGFVAHSATPSVNLGVIHAETRIEVESSIDEKEDEEEKAAAFDPTTVASTAHVRIQGPMNEARKTPSQR